MWMIHLSRRRTTITSVLSLLIGGPAAGVVVAALPRPAAPQAAAGETVLVLDPDQSKVHWTLGTTLHAVHGTFAFKSGTLQFDSATGKASGEIAVYATSGDSGNDSRDRKMHKEVLESARYPDVVFRPDRVEGKIVPHGTFTVQVHGTFVVHGGEHELTVPV